MIPRRQVLADLRRLTSSLRWMVGRWEQPQSTTRWEESGTIVRTPIAEADKIENSPAEWASLAGWLRELAGAAYRLAEWADQQGESTRIRVESAAGILPDRPAELPDRIDNDPVRRLPRER
jgi:hypothetical protein